MRPEAIPLMYSDWTIRWIVIASLSLIDAGWLWVRGVGFEYHALSDPLSVAVVLLAVCLITTFALARLRVLTRFFTGTNDFFYSTIQFTLLVPPVVTLSYLAATLDAPLVDRALLRADAIVGFDWHALDDWVAAHRWIWWTLREAYLSLYVQPMAALFVVSMHQPGKTNGEFIWTFLISAVLCFSIFAVLPAIGYDGLIGPDHIAALKQARAGEWTTLDFTKANGIVTFPSFHAIFAVILTYAVRRVRWVLAIVAPLNAAMIMATPTVGGHYLVDVAAGVAVAIISIRLAAAIQRRIATATRGRGAARLGAPLPAYARAPLPHPARQLVAPRNLAPSSTRFRIPRG